MHLIQYDSLIRITSIKPGISFEMNNELATNNSNRTAELKIKVMGALTTTRPPGPLMEESCDIETALLYLRMNKNSSIDNYTDPLASKYHFFSILISIFWLTFNMDVDLACNIVKDLPLTNRYFSLFKYKITIFK